ncbi:MAG: protoporphyrinogen/coproporphyrinogen oxidase [Solirubrobacterales bacterium]
MNEGHPGRVAVVGAGLAGLRCAGLLIERGFEVDVFEASDRVGGRVRTDEVDGFLLDRGFQVLLTSYPEARKAFDFRALDLGRFEPGALIRHDGGFVPLVDPLRRPSGVFSSLDSPVGTFRDRLRLARMRFSLAGKDPERIDAEPQVPAGRYLEDQGFSEDMVESFFRPFFGGVLIDPDLATSSALLKLYFGYFATGDAALPAEGMGCLAAQLASRLPEGSISLDSPVEEVSSDSLRLADGDSHRADAVVVATDERSAARLLDRPDPGPGSVTACLYFDAPEEDVSSRTLFLAGKDRGPINEVAIPSSIARGYAPPGRSLVSASAVGENALRDDLADSAKVQLGNWFGHGRVAGWRHLDTTVVTDALPPIPPGRFAPGRIPPRQGPGPFACGDYMESPSIQGALVSGRRAAEAIAREVGHST